MTPTVPAGSVVIAYDSSGHSAEAVAWGLVQAALERRRVDIVHLLNVAEVQSAAWIASSRAGGPVPDVLREGAVADLHPVVDLARRQHPGLQVDGHVIEQETREGLVELSESAHLIVLGSHGWGPVGSLLLGSVAAAVTRRAQCPVVVVRPPADTRLSDADGTGVLVGVDGTPESAPVIEHAFAQASLRDLHLTAVHCVRDPASAWAGDSWSLDAQESTKASDVVLASLAGAAERHPDVAYTAQVEQGMVTQVSGDHARPWDLVVVGRHQHGAWHRLLMGSTTTAVLEHAHCPVLVVPEVRVPTGRG